MTNTKTHGIRDSNFEELIKKLNEFSKENNVIATQTHQHQLTGEWFAIVYYNQGERLTFAKATSFQKPSPSGNPKTPEKEDNTPATEIQISFLKKNKYMGNISNLTKYEAWELINKFKRGLK